MRSYLIVANQTLESRSLAEAISGRLAEGPISAYVVVPLVPVGGRLTWDEAASREVAQGRLADILDRLAALDIEADGEVGDRDPVAAVRDAIRGRTFDEIVVSTLPQGLSRWLVADVPTRIRDTVTIPVTVVTQADD